MLAVKSSLVQVRSEPHIVEQLTEPGCPVTVKREHLGYGLTAELQNQEVHEAHHDVGA